MANASTLENMSPQLGKVVERAQREPEGRFHSLAHLMDVPAAADVVRYNVRVEGEDVQVEVG